MRPFNGFRPLGLSRPCGACLEPTDLYSLVLKAHPVQCFKCVDGADPRLPGTEAAMSQERSREARRMRGAVPRSRYDEIYREQGGKCAICREYPGFKDLDFERSPKTGGMRGFLCQVCKAMIQKNHESIGTLSYLAEASRTHSTDKNLRPPEVYEAAVEYIRKY